MIRLANFASTLATLPVLICSVVGIVYAAGATQFDGKWTAQAATESGGCKAQYSFKFKVKEGYVKGRIKGQKGSYKLTGPIVLDGTTELALDGFDAGRFDGVFEGAKAEGTWKTKNCNGTFTFKKKL